MRRLLTLTAGALAILAPGLALAEEAAAPTVAELSVAADTVWVLLCAFLAGVTTSGLFAGGGATQLIAQLKGVGAVAAFTLVASGLVWLVLKATLGIRVSAEDELQGLDVAEMGMEAYPDELGHRASPEETDTPRLPAVLEAASQATGG